MCNKKSRLTRSGGIFKILPLIPHSFYLFSHGKTDQCSHPGHAAGARLVSAVNRLRRETVLVVIGEKIPYLIIAAAITAVSISIGVKGGFISYELLSFGQRCILSGNAIFEYVRLTLIPIGILPQRIIISPFPVSYTVKTVVAVVAICLSVGAVRWNRWLMATMLFFLLPIIPVLSFFQANDWLYGPRHTYLPSAAISIMAAYGISAGLGRVAGSGRRIITVLALCLTASLIIFHGVVSYQRIGDWKDSGTMWTRIIDNEPYGRAFFLRGLYYTDSGNFQAAADDYTMCLKVAAQENYPEIFMVNIHSHRGEALAGAGRYDEALRDFSTAIEKVPHPLYYYHRGNALKTLGRAEEAGEDLLRAGTAKGQMRWLTPESHRT